MLDTVNIARALDYPLNRREVVAALLEQRGDMAVVAGLGAPNWDCTAAGDHPLTFPLWGAMGGAAMMGLGIAIAQPGRRVLVLTGDGEMLMGIGALASIGIQKPANLAVVVLDNERYGETGMQATATAACEMPQACSNREGPRHPRRRRATGWLRRAGLWNSSRFMILLCVWCPCVQGFSVPRPRPGLP